MLARLALFQHLFSKSVAVNNIQRRTCRPQRPQWRHGPVVNQSLKDVPDTRHWRGISLSKETSIECYWTFSPRLIIPCFSFWRNVLRGEMRRNAWQTFSGKEIDVLLVCAHALNRHRPSSASSGRARPSTGWKRCSSGHYPSRRRTKVSGTSSTLPTSSKTASPFASTYTYVCYQIQKLLVTSVSISTR